MGFSAERCRSMSDIRFFADRTPRLPRGGTGRAAGRSSSNNAPHGTPSSVLCRFQMKEKKERKENEFLQSPARWNTLNFQRDNHRLHTEHRILCQVRSPTWNSRGRLERRPPRTRPRPSLLAASRASPSAAPPAPGRALAAKRNERKTSLITVSIMFTSRATRSMALRKALLNGVPVIFRWE